MQLVNAWWYARVRQGIAVSRPANIRSNGCEVFPLTVRLVPHKFEFLVGPGDDATSNFTLHQVRLRAAARQPTASP